MTYNQYHHSAPQLIHDSEADPLSSLSRSLPSRLLFTNDQTLDFNIVNRSSSEYLMSLNQAVMPVPPPPPPSSLAQPCAGSQQSRDHVALLESNWLDQLSPPVSSAGASATDWNTHPHPHPHQHQQQSLTGSCHASNAPAIESSALAFEPDPELMRTFDQIVNTLPIHAQVPSESNTCHQCNQRFRIKARLDSHASQTKHQPYACLCGEKFSRFDVLNRHIDRFCPRKFYPCPYCSKYTSFNAFHRQDHLTQHLRNDHKIDVTKEPHEQDSDDSLSPPKKAGKGRSNIMITCDHEGCLHYASMPLGDAVQRSFQTRKELTKHIRDEHDSSPHPCNEPGCSRVRGKGYFREKDLIKHHMKDHKERVLT